MTEKKWPDCFKDCQVVKELGASECEEGCPKKFEKGDDEKLYNQLVWLLGENIKWIPEIRAWEYRYYFIFNLGRNSKMIANNVERILTRGGFGVTVLEHKEEFDKEMAMGMHYFKVIFRIGKEK